MVNVGTKVAMSATEALKILWEGEFFSTWKQKGPVVEALAKKGNHFSDPELGMALMRASYLTRRGKRGQYEYIQKYPFVTEETVKSAKRKNDARE
jgi:hypothetical protein